MTDFLKRLEKILGGRKVNPWGKGLGMSGSVISAIKADSAPGADYLELIGLAEGASLDYLLTGKGAPFCVEQYQPKQFTDRIKKAPEDFTIYMAYGAGKSVFTIQESIHIKIKTRDVEFKKFEIITCNYDDILLDAIEKHPNTVFVSLDAARVDIIKQGQLGLYGCLGDEKTPGIFNNRIIDDKKKRTEFIKTIKTEKHELAPAKNNDIDKTLLKAVLNLVEEVIADTGETITSEEKAMIVASLYSIANKQNLDSAGLTSQSVLSMIEMLN